jgi:hypothetical protein
MADAVVAKVAHPWRRVLRTIIAGLPGAVIAVPLIINQLNLDPDKYPKLYAFAAGVLALTAIITRLLAISQVEAFLQKTLKFLAADDVATEDTLAVVPGAVVGPVDNTTGAVAGTGSELPTGSAVVVTSSPVTNVNIEPTAPPLPE